MKEGVKKGKEARLQLAKSLLEKREFLAYTRLNQTSSSRNVMCNMWSQLCVNDHGWVPNPVHKGSGPLANKKVFLQDFTHKVDIISMESGCVAPVYFLMTELDCEYLHFHNGNDSKMREEADLVLIGTNRDDLRFLVKSFVSTVDHANNPEAVFRKFRNMAYDQNILNARLASDARKAVCSTFGTPQKESTNEAKLPEVTRTGDGDIKGGVPTEFNQQFVIQSDRNVVKDDEEDLKMPASKKPKHGREQIMDEKFWA
jgi:hypothetical protein